MSLPECLVWYETEAEMPRYSDFQIILYYSEILRSWVHEYMNSTCKL